MHPELPHVADGHNQIFFGKLAWSYRMPVTYKIDPAKSLIRTQCIGDVNPEEIADHFRALARDPNRPDRLNVLLDVSEESSLPETKDLREVTQHMKELLPRVRFNACAIVASGDAHYGMMRMWQVFVEKYFIATRVFRGIPEAEEWLELHSQSDS